MTGPYIYSKGISEDELACGKVMIDGVDPVSTLWRYLFALRYISVPFGAYIIIVELITLPPATNPSQKILYSISRAPSLLVHE